MNDHNDDGTTTESYKGRTHNVHPFGLFYGTSMIEFVRAHFHCRRDSPMISAAMFN